MQRKYLILLLMGCLYQMPSLAASDLLDDEQGPTAYGAVDTLTAGDDFLLPSYTVPVNPVLPTSNTPQPVPSDVDILSEVFGSDSPQTKNLQVLGASPRGTRTFTPNEGVQNLNEPLLTELPPLPEVANEIHIPQKAPIPGKSRYADQVLAQSMAQSTDGVALPKELKVKFYPGQSTFSSQALKWIKSFAVRVAQDPRLLAEIRVSDRDWTVQERRLNIVTQVLAEAGVTPHQIRIYKSDRDLDTLLIGYVPNPEQTLTKMDKMHEKVQKTIDW